MDVVADAGPVAGRIVCPEDAEVAALARGDFRRDLDQMGRFRRPLTCPQLDVCPRHVEIAQDRRSHARHTRDVLEHEFRCELRVSIGIDGRGMNALINDHPVRLAVDGGG